MASRKQKIKTIGVLTSGGDAPGMNAAIRAVIRTAIYLGMDVIGIHKGYTGVLKKKFEPMTRSSVANIIQRGGTILRTDRCKEFHQKSMRKLAAKNLREHNIDALVVIGGNGSFTGAHALWQETKMPVIGVPATIDNDLYGTEITIGFDTAINTGIQAIDQIRDTASALERVFLVEVMGRNSGYIAMDVGLGGGAEVIVVPEVPTPITKIAKKLKDAEKRGKTSSIVVVAEGKVSGNSFRIAEDLEKKYQISSRVCVLGHIQRGGRPTARDRKVASALGALAVKAIKSGETDKMVGIQGYDGALVPLKTAIKKRKNLHKDLIRLSHVLAT